MASREEYTKCMTPHMQGAGKSKEERQQSMCIGAKLCSKKASNEEEARRLCAEAAANPKPPKAAKKGKKFCYLDLNSLSACMTANINVAALTPENMQQVFAEALASCSGASAKITVKKAKRTVEELTPKELEALQTITKLGQQFEGKAW